MDKHAPMTDEKTYEWASDTQISVRFDDRLDLTPLISAARSDDPGFTLYVYGTKHNRALFSFDFEITPGRFVRALEKCGFEPRHKRHIDRQENAWKMTDHIQVSRLIFQDIPGAGLQIHAHIDRPVNCVEFTIKGGCEQAIMHTPKDPPMIGYEPFIQFAPKQWDEMLNRILGQMVDLWNEKYACEQGFTN